MVHCLGARGFDQVDALIYGLNNSRWIVDPGAKVLDFGCGGGELVYQFRDRGFDAHGFDLFDTVTLRCPEDRRLFSHLVDARSNPADTRIDDTEMKLPYEDSAFDLVVSMTVIEHCYALDGMMRECARVLKPGGVSIHLYPSRSQLIEPHFFVPFGGLVQRKWWLHLWALMGVRNDGQRAMTADEAAEHNLFYIRSGLAYRPNKQVAAITGRHFNQVRFIERAYYPSDPLGGKARALIKALTSNKLYQELSGLIRCRVLLASHPKR